MIGFKGEITEDGVYTASSVYGNFYKGCGMRYMVAVKAELPTGEYGITVIEKEK